MNTLRLACAALLMSIFYPAWGDDVTNKISVCDLGKAPEKIDGAQVRLLAKYMTDLRHGSLFFSDHCSTSVREGANRSTHVDKSVDAFHHAVQEHSLPRGLITFEVDVSGTFHLQEHAPSDTSPGSSGAFVIEKVWSFRRIEANQ